MLKEVQSVQSAGNGTTTITDCFARLPPLEQQIFKGT